MRVFPLAAAVGWVLILTGGAGHAEERPAAGPYAAYDALLREYVDAQGWVDYARWKREDEPALRQAVAGFAKLDPDRMSAIERKAYWINVYNAVTLQAMLEFYPLDSIKDKQSILPGGYKIWDDYTFGPSERSLNQIEHELLRPLGDPRIHAAVVCASRGCPPLRAEAFLPARLDAQLTAQTKVWLRDPQRGLRIAGDQAHLSRVFDWFGDDFAKDDAGKLRWVATYVDAATAAKLRAGGLEVDYLDWDWSLNRQ